MKRYDELLKDLEQAARAFTFIPHEAAVRRDAAAAIRELQAIAEKAEAEIAEAKRREAEADERMRKAGESVNLFFGCDTPDHMADEILGLRAELQRLREIVAKLPKTADGVPVIDGDTVWHRDWDGTVIAHTFLYHCDELGEYYVATPGMLRCCYSSREAAALAAKGGGK